MPEVVERIEITAPPEQVWAALTAWERQGEWMLATDVVVVGGDPRGVGGRIEARTGLPVPGGRRVGVLDSLEITSWQPPHRVEVLHTGRLVRGPGVFQLQGKDGGTLLVWKEILDLPLGALGRLAWPLMRPVVSLGLRLSLRRFTRFARDFAG